MTVSDAVGATRTGRTSCEADIALDRRVDVTLRLATRADTGKVLDARMRKVLPTPPAARDGSPTSSSLGSGDPVPAARTGSTPGCGPTTPSPPWAAWTFAGDVSFSFRDGARGWCRQVGTAHRRERPP